MEHGTTSHHGTTTFVDDGQQVVNDMQYVASVDNTIVSLNDTQNVEQRLIDFLSKPLVIFSGNFNITDTYSFLQSLEIPYFPFAAGVGEMWSSKLRGYFGIRFTMRFKIVVNANKFQQGRYCIGWVPLTGATHTSSSLKQIAFNNMHMASLVQRTTVHHTEVDLNSMTSAELVVPFQSVRAFYPLNAVFSTSTQYSLGFLNVYPYSPLVSPAGSTVAGYTVYMSLENIKLIGASSPQSGLKSRHTKDKELGNTLNGPISSVASSVAKGMTLFRDIPLIGSYARDISWVSDKIAKVSSIFGWSKPSQGDSAVKMISMIAPAHSNMDGDSDARSMALLSKPGVVPIDGLSGTQLDEMDFAFIVRKYAYYDQFNWSTSNIKDDVLHNVTVGPGGKILGTASSTVSFTPMAFVSYFFQQWRGSIKFRFKIVKTDFHSGRIQVCFFPGDVTTLTAEPEYVNRMIIDIRDTQEFEIVVPFMSANMWNSLGEFTGRVLVTVLDPLVAPATVSSTVTFLCEIAGGDDYEVSIPEAFSYTPTLITPQSGLSAGNTDNIVSATIGCSQVHGDPIAGTSIAIGDSVTNFRAYLKRFSQIVPRNSNVASTNKFNNRTLILSPDAIICRTTAAGDNYNADALSMIASCYGIFRGGVRIRDIINKGLYNGTTTFGQSPTVVSIDKPADSQTLLPFDTFSDTSLPNINFSKVIQDTTVTQSVTVEIPQYTRTYGRSICDAMVIYNGGAGEGYDSRLASSTTRARLWITPPRLPLGTPLDIAGFSLHNVYRAMADDGDLSVFISIPPLANNSLTVGGAGFY